jgi:hypothetical protein
MINQNTEFSQTELRAMHRWCLKYQDVVCSDGTTTPEQDRKFLAFSKVTYSEGVALGHS